MESDFNIGKKIVFFVRSGLDSFLGDIINDLSSVYEVKKVVVTEYKQIDEGMQWADICWFEWCDEFIGYGSKHRLAIQKKIVCRLHSYEAFTQYPASVNWDAVDKLILVAEHIQNFVIEKFKLEREKTVVISNGIDMNKLSFKERTSGFNIAYVGYINYKKGPMLLLHAFKAIYDKDPRYRLYIAGEFQDERDILYYDQMIKEMRLEKNILFQGWQNNLDEWLEDKNYIICTSVLESQNISVMQAMAKGIKPLIHNFVGAKSIYASKYIWNTIDEVVNMIISNTYHSNEYRNYIDYHFSLVKQMSNIKNVLDCLFKEKPLVIVGIANYNYGRFLDQCIGSVLNQSYKNIEILIIDDCSTDDSIPKIKSYEAKYTNIRGIFHSENSGRCVLAFQEIISECSGKGEYFFILSADDYLASDKLIKEFVDILESQLDLDYVHGNLKIIDEDGDHRGDWKYVQYNTSDVVEYVFKRGGSGIIPITSGLHRTDFFRRNHLTWVDDKDNFVASDTLNTLVYLKYQWKYKYINVDSICYRQHSCNMTQNVYKRIKSIISVMEYVVRTFDESLYFTDINWGKMDQKERQSLKAYRIGKMYWDLLVMYYSGEWQPWDFSSDCNKYGMIESVQPLVDKVILYLDSSLNISDRFQNEIDVIKKDMCKMTQV